MKLYFIKPITFPEKWPITRLIVEPMKGLLVGCWLAVGGHVGLCVCRCILIIMISFIFISFCIVFSVKTLNSTCVHKWVVGWKQLPLGKEKYSLLCKWCLNQDQLQQYGLNWLKGRNFHLGPKIVFKLLGVSFQKINTYPQLLTKTPQAKSLLTCVCNNYSVVIE